MAERAAAENAEKANHVNRKFELEQAGKINQYQCSTGLLPVQNLSSTGLVHVWYDLSSSITCDQSTN